MDPNSIFSTKRLNIRRLALSDLMNVYKHRSDPATSKYIGKPATLDDALTRVNMALLPWNAREGERLILAVECKTTGEFVGELVFKFVSTEHQYGEIGYRLAANFHGKGLAFEASNAFIKYLFRHYLLSKINAICAVDNVASWKLMERIGMKREGRIRHFLRLPMGTTDCFTYGILKHEALEPKLVGN